jgi:hypothetical protein
MKVIKLLGIGLLSLVTSFFLVFTVTEVAKSYGSSPQFGAHKPYDVVIKNARMIDGTGGEIRRADIGIRDGVIIEIGNNLKTDGAQVFNAAGFTVSPNIVEWPENLEWVQRDLTTALKRYTEERVIIAQAQNKEWEGRSIKALNHSGISKDNLSTDSTAIAWIMPQMDIPEAKDVNTAFYLLTGWRGELLEKKIGKIAEGYPAHLVVFNHRVIIDGELFNILIQENLPPIEYFIEGSTIQSTKTDS